MRVDTFVMIVVLVLVYALPTIVASARTPHKKTVIVLVNLFLGWSVLGWLIAMIWAATNPPADGVSV
jgi:hypothetical protein